MTEAAEEQYGPAPAPAEAPAVTRLCIKNLPKHCDEKRLKQHFTRDGGEVTDVRVMRTQAGKSRLFGFVGFRTPEAAAAAQKHFARSFIDTSRIIVEASKPVGDDSLARPWSRHSKGSSAWARSHPEEAEAAKAKAKASAGGGAASGSAAGGKKPRGHESELKAKLAADPKLAEFLELMGSKRKEVWKNDGGVPGSAAAQAGAAKGGMGAKSGPAWKDEATGEEEAGGEAAAAEGEAEDEEDYQELPQPGQATGAALAKKSKKVAAAAEAAAPAPEATEEAVAAEAAASDLDYLRSKMVGSLDESFFTESSKPEARLP